MNPIYVKVNDLRPNDLNKGLKNAAENDYNTFFSKTETFVEGICPVCLNRNSDISLTTPNNARYCRCNKCKTLYLDKHPSSEDYIEYYKKSEVMNFFSKYIFPHSLEKRKQYIYFPRLKRLISSCEKNAVKGIYMEVGAGSGSFAKLVKDSCYFSDVFVVEPNDSCACDCKKQNIKTYHKAVEEMDTYPDGLNVIANFECIEHLVNPKLFIQAVYRLLPQNGFFILTTPNGMGFDVIELGGKSTTLGWTHIHLFNPYSIKILLQDIGFKIIEISTPGVLDVDLVKSSFQEKERESPWLHEILLHGDEQLLNRFQNFLVENHLSSHMWIVAKK